MNVTTFQKKKYTFVHIHKGAHKKYRITNKNDFNRVRKMDDGDLCID